MKKTLFIYNLPEDKKKAVREKIFSSKAFRKEYFKYDFYSFCVWMFREEFFFKFAEFQKEYVEALAQGKDIFFVWFRWSAKSTLLIYYYIWCIVYEKRHYIMHYNSNLTKSKEVLRTIAQELIENQRIIELYGKLFSQEVQKKENKKPKTIWNFITENWIKIEAMSIWNSPRWKNFKYKWVTYRPDLVWFDDIDTDKNLSQELIEKDVAFILWEVFGGLEAYAQKIFLWNVIKDFGRVPKLKEHFSKNKNFKMFWVSIRQKWKIVWERYVATNKKAQELNKNISNPKHHVISLEALRADQGMIAYNQNYNLIPYLDWTSIIKKTLIHYYNNLPKRHQKVIWIDPAFSEKTKTDPIWITITAQEKFEKDYYFYVIESLELKEKEKNNLFFIKTIKNLSTKYDIDLIVIENNNWWAILADLLKREKLGIEVKVINSDKDKVSRLIAYQSDFERWFIKFNKNNFLVGDLIEQLILFPNVEHDDMVDSMVFSFTPVLKNKIKILWA